MRLPAIIFALFVLAGPGMDSKVHADDNELASGEVIIQRVGFTEDQFPGTATRDAEVAIDYWFKLMSERQRLNQIPNTTVFPTFAEMHGALKNGLLDIVSILSLDFLRAREEVELEPFSVTTRGEDVYTEYVVYVHKDGGIDRLEQLAGKKVLIDASEGAELVSYWFETALLREDIDPEGFLTTESVDKASRAILPVYFKQAAACVAANYSFENMKEMNPRIGVDLVPLKASAPLLAGIVCFTSEIDPVRKPDIVRTLNTLHEDPQGQQVLNLFRRDQAVPYESRQLESLLALVEERRRLEAERDLASPVP